MSMQMVQTMICSVCGDDMNSDCSSSAVEVLLKGAVALKICPCCKHPVGDFKDRNYRRRAMRWINKQRRLSVKDN
jgi:hypothetical protein